MNLGVSLFTCDKNPFDCNVSIFKCRPFLLSEAKLKSPIRIQGARGNFWLRIESKVLIN